METICGLGKTGNGSSSCRWLLLKRNFRKLKELKLVLKNLKKSKSEVWKFIAQSEKKIQRLNRKIGKERDVIRELINSEVALRVAIGKVKGLHCPAKQRCADYTPYYNCALSTEEEQLELEDFYEESCFSCKLSASAIYTGILMRKLKGKEKR